jgi:hypothetical protein
MTGTTQGTSEDETIVALVELKTSQDRNDEHLIGDSHNKYCSISLQAHWIEFASSRKKKKKKSQKKENDIAAIIPLTKTTYTLNNYQD